MSSQKRLVRTPALWTLYALVASYSFFLTSIGPAIPFLRAEFHFDYTMAALHVSAFAVGMVLSGATASAVMRRGVHLSIWGGQFGLLVGLTALVLAPAPWVSLLGILVAGYTGTISLAAVQAAVAAQAGPHRGKALLEANIAASLTSSLAPFVLVLGTLAGTGWRILWPVFVLILAVALALGFRPVTRAVPDRPPEEHHAQGRLPRSFVRAWLLIVVGVAVEWCFGFWAASYLKGLPGGSDSLAVAGAGAFQLAAVAGRWLSSRMTGRFGEKRILAIAILAAAVGFPLYWSLLNAWLAIGGLMLCGMAVATFYPLGLSQAMGAAGSQTAKASSLAAAGSGTAVLSAPLALGAMADSWGLGPALFAIPVGLMLMLLLLLVRRKG